MKEKLYVVNNVKRRRNRTVKNKSCFDIANVVLAVFLALVVRRRRRGERKVDDIDLALKLSSIVSFSIASLLHAWASCARDEKWFGDHWTSRVEKKTFCQTSTFVRFCVWDFFSSVHFFSSSFASFSLSRNMLNSFTFQSGRERDYTSSTNSHKVSRRGLNFLLPFRKFPESLLYTERATIKIKEKSCSWFLRQRCCSLYVKPRKTRILNRKTRKMSKKANGILVESLA